MNGGGRLGAPFGARAPRVEDAPLLAGAGTYAADWRFGGEIHMRIVRSPVAHGVLRSVGVGSAERTDGVVGVWRADDIALPPIAFRPTSYRGLEPYRQPVLASGRVRYAGEPVAAVFAESPASAEDGAAAVEVDVAELAPNLDALAPPTEFDSLHGTEACVVRKSYGSVDEAFARAHAEVALELVVGRHSGVPLECRGGVARVDPGTGVLELYGATKRAHANRDQLASALGRDPASVHLFEGDIGGGFGIRGELYPEDFLICAAAIRYGRPVRWIEDRREHLAAANQSREQRHRIRAAVDGDGRILAIDDEFFHDQGAYLRTHGVRVPDLSAGLLLGPYRVPAYRAVGHVRLTNKTPAATYRAPGRFEGSFVRERLLDAVAARVGISPVEARRRNLIAPEEMPYTRTLDALDVEVVLDSGDYEGLLDRALEAFRWRDLNAGLAVRRARGELAGAGLGLFVEKSGLGPRDLVRIEIDRRGRIEVLCGAADLGQGVRTALAQICAACLGVDHASLNVVQGRTDRIEEGYGSHASRTTAMTGEAARRAADALLGALADPAARLLQADADDLVVGGGRVRHRGTGASLAWEEIVRQSGGERISAEGRYETDHMNAPYGAHLAVVSIDSGTGVVRVERFLVAYDIGRAVNPMLAEGQLIGGLAQGIGGTLFEEFRYDDGGQPLSLTLADYVLPGATEVPRPDLLLTEDAPSPLNSLGVKGAGEGGIAAVGAAVAAAIDDAIGAPGAVTELPVTPRRMLELLKRVQTTATA